MSLASNVHPLKASIPIEFIDVERFMLKSNSGRVMFASNVHPFKASIPIEFIDIGRFILEIDS